MWDITIHSSLESNSYKCPREKSTWSHLNIEVLVGLGRGADFTLLTSGPAHREMWDGRLHSLGQ